MRIGKKPAADVPGKAGSRQKVSPPVVWEGIVGLETMNPEGIKRSLDVVTDNVGAENVFTEKDV